MINSLISVIIPVYNVEKYIHKCINSVLNQSYTNLEIILVNDGSIDNCGDICDEYALKDSRIKVIHKENGGLSSARNSGLDIAKGEFIGFIDSDDYIHTDMYKILYENMKLTNCDISQCSTVLDGDEFILNNQKTIIYENEDYFKALITEKLSWSVWCNLYKRKIFDDIRFENGYYYEDILIFPLIYKLKPSIVKTNLKLYNYIRHENGILRMKKNLKHLSSKELVYRTMINNFNDTDHYNLLAFYICKNIPAFRGIIQSNENITKTQSKKHNQEMHKMFCVYFRDAKKNTFYKKEKVVKRIMWNLYYLLPKITTKITIFLKK